MDTPSKLASERELDWPSTSPPGKTPAARPGWLGASLAVVGALVSALYLANVTGGFVEFPPDNFPGVGNLDEFAFSLLLVYCLQKLGINLLPFMKPGALPLGEARRADRK